MKQTKEKTEITRINILKSALKLFSTKGYTLTTLQDIADDSKVTRGAIYHHFKDKTEIYKTVVAENFEPINKQFSELFSHNNSILESLETFMIQFLTLIEENDTYKLILELTLLKTEVTQEIQGLLEEKNKQTAELVSFLSKLISKGITTEIFRPDINPYLTSISLLSYIYGLATFYLLNPASFSTKNDSSYLIRQFTRNLIL